MANLIFFDIAPKSHANAEWDNRLMESSELIRGVTNSYLNSKSPNQKAKRNIEYLEICCFKELLYCFLLSSSVISMGS